MGSPGTGELGRRAPREQPRYHPSTDTAFARHGSRKMLAERTIEAPCGQVTVDVTSGAPPRLSHYEKRSCHVSQGMTRGGRRSRGSPGPDMKRGSARDA